MITLTDVRNDLRIRKEAQSVARVHEVSVICNIRSLPPGPLRYEGLSVFNVRLATRRLPKSPVFWVIKYLEFLLRSVAVAYRRRATVYHGHDITGALPALLASRLRRSRFLYDAHELEADRAGFVQQHRWLNRLFLFCVRAVLRRADHVICASELRADIMLREYGVRELPTPVLNVTPMAGMPTGSDVNQTFLECDFTGKQVVLYQGTLARGRGLDRAVAALSLLDENVMLVVIGHGAGYDDLISQARRDGTRHRLIMVGAVPADSLASYMKRAHVGLVIYQNTCRNNYYCAPNKVYEYASAGLPIVGPNFPEIDNLLARYDMGRTFDPEDPAGIAGAIREVLAEPERLRKMSAVAASVRNFVNWETEERKLLAAYDGLLRSVKSPAPHAAG